MSFRNKVVLMWENKDCVSWAESLSSDSRVDAVVRKALIAELKGNHNIKGGDLIEFFGTAKDLRRELGDSLAQNVKSCCLTTVCKAFTRYQRSMAGNPRSTFNVVEAAAKGYTAPNKSNNGKFTVFVMMKKGGYKKIHNMTSQMKVSDLKAAIYYQEGIESSEYMLHYHRVLRDTYTLGKCNIKNETVVHMTVSNGAGTTSMAVNRRHINYSKYPNIKKTRKPDCLFGYTFAEGYSVAEMPCGHVMEAESMHMYMKSKITKNLHCKIMINCPLPKCQTVWDFQLCCRVAGMSDDEYVRMTRVKDIRGRDDVRECPNCKMFCTRKANVSILRMKCSKCNGRDWCWVCGKYWRSSSLMICKNRECPFVSSLNEQLKSCDSSVPFGWEELEVPYGKSKELPDIRACPGCYLLTLKPQQPEATCKHMTCKGCGKKYCFSCLKDQSACTNPSYTQYCDVEPKQQFS